MHHVVILGLLDHTEVRIDGELCRYAQGEGLAKDYDGEGARPEWWEGVN